ncbi:LysR family transcriptional regulator [Carnobacterium pleistocenium]|uniref:LysR family transcriptional regulator n=1 Tax=Carnobacterium pleistocenium TaxID=181073 RepID=UPI000552ED6B|nr:LysR family transcriptional regulator [Carnobacterium pleistocenium]
MYNNMIVRYLEALIADGTFTQAAKSLYISQPYLSKYITKIEEELKTSLVDRTHNPIELTYSGERYLSHMKSIQVQYDDMLDELSLITNLRKGRIRIGVQSLMGTFLLPMILPSFQKDYSEIEFKILEQSPKLTEQDIQENKIDFYLGLMPKKDDSLSAIVLTEDRWCVIVPKTSALYQSGLKKITLFPYPLTILKNEKYVLTNQESGIRRQTNEFFKKLSIKASIVLESKNIFTASALARKGMGLTFLPESALSEIESFHHYNVFYIDPKIMCVSYFIAYKKNKALSTLELTFIDHVKTQLKNYS